MQSRAASTIYALATPVGKGGVAVLRISGPHAQAALTFLGVKATPAPRMATLARLHDDGRELDQALILSFVAPHSFSGEDVVELHLHGGVAVVQSVLETLGKCDGLRLAEPGEFTRRAFMNDKMDLAQAEGLADLIDAQTQAQQRQAMRQLGGETSQRVADLRERILTPLALLEAYIDFPDEEIPDEVLQETTNRVETLVSEIKELLNDGGIGQKIREGLEIVILGPPNAGKSSLLNTLANRDAAIVSPEAGTTRDMVEVHLNIAGYEVTLVDTAGLRETTGAIEAEGIRRARNRADQADFTLVLLEAETARERFSEIAPLLDARSQLVLTKADRGPLPDMPEPYLAISTLTGHGLDALIETIRAQLVARMESVPSPLITRARHREALAEAQRALQGWTLDLPLELACEHLRLAASALGKITGKIWVDDVLDLVFSRFCIGK
jgi:tRNA modification GTPase